MVMVLRFHYHFLLFVICVWCVVVEGEEKVCVVVQGPLLKGKEKGCVVVEGPLEEKDASWGVGECVCCDTSRGVW